MRKEDSERGLSRENVRSRGALGEHITIFDLRELDGSICAFAFRLVWVGAPIRVIFMKWDILLLMCVMALIHIATEHDVLSAAVFNECCSAQTFQELFLNPPL